MHTKKEYIAVFDSGVGGISVLRELVKRMPNEKYLYFGDSANAPYGSRSTQEVRGLTMAAADMLLQRNVKALVVACNTATAVAINDLRAAYPDVIIIGIEPALKMAADRFPRGTIGVMATSVTLREEKFHQQIERFPGARVEVIPANGLVPMVEKGLLEGPEVDAYLQDALGKYVGKLDALVLGCTHFPFVAEAVQKVMGEKTLILDGGEGTARETERRLAEAGLCNDGPGSVQIENSAGDARLMTLAAELLER